MKASLLTLASLACITGLLHAQNPSEGLIEPVTEAVAGPETTPPSSLEQPPSLPAPADQPMPVVPPPAAEVPPAAPGSQRYLPIPRQGRRTPVFP
ncbi:MAG: hypothetical protein MUC40_07830 [Akkermansiaceae bacterium]|nr:hypothetical protein [Akkermansiaceae bacterium]